MRKYLLVSFLGLALMFSGYAGTAYADEMLGPEVLPDGDFEGDLTALTLIGDASVVAGAGVDGSAGLVTNDNSQCVLIANTNWPETVYKGDYVFSIDVKSSDYSLFQVGIDTSAAGGNWKAPIAPNGNWDIGVEATPEWKTYTGRCHFSIEEGKFSFYLHRFPWGNTANTNLCFDNVSLRRDLLTLAELASRIAVLEAAPAGLGEGDVNALIATAIDTDPTTPGTDIDDNALAISALGADITALENEIYGYLTDPIDPLTYVPGILDALSEIEAALSKPGASGSSRYGKD